MSKQTLTDLVEVLSVNTLTLATAMFTNIESVLKIVLLLVSIGYTSYKWISDHKQKNK